jgi:hypothetical protein
VTRGRFSSDRWAQYAHHLLDRARDGGAVSSARIGWALAYLGDRKGCTKIPANLLTGRLHWRPVHA